MSVLEVIALDTADARAAEAGGADRLELVADMSADGLTPALDTVAAIREACALELRVMLRPGPGFAATELDELTGRANAFVRAGADGFVLGFLTKESTMDISAMRLLAETVDKPWTCHRAVDYARDYTEALAAIAQLPSIDQVLTAGHSTGIAAGIDTVRAARATVPVMAGGGLRREHVPRLVAAGITAFHIGSGARSDWSSPVSAKRVATWRQVIDDCDKNVTE